MTTTTTLVAYHGKHAEKDALIAQLQAHYDADEIIKGVYWQRGKGCAVGCTVHSGDHSLYESIYGIPESLAHLEDTLFELLPDARAKEWPLQFARAIAPGADLSRVEWQFKHWLLMTPEVNPGITHSLVRDAVETVAELCERAANGDMPCFDEWSAARSAALSAAESAESAAESAAWSAAWSAETAARSAGSAAWTAARGAGWSAASAMADKLLELLASVPVAEGSA